jgi:hypothetical protein
MEYDSRDYDPSLGDYDPATGHLMKGVRSSSDQRDIESFENEGGAVVVEGDHVVVKTYRDRIVMPRQESRKKPFGRMQYKDPDEQKIYEVLAFGPNEWQPIKAMAAITGLSINRTFAIVTKYYARGGIVRHPKNDDLYGFWERVRRHAASCPLTVCARDLDEYRLLNTMIWLAEDPLLEWCNPMTLRLNTGIHVDRINKILRKYAFIGIVKESPQYPGAWKIKNVSVLKPGFTEESPGETWLRPFEGVPEATPIVEGLIELQKMVYAMDRFERDATQLCVEFDKVVGQAEAVMREFEIYV